MATDQRAGDSIISINQFFSKPQYSGFELFLGSDVKKTETGLKSIIVGMGLVSRSLETTPYDKLD